MPDFSLIYQFALKGPLPIDARFLRKKQLGYGRPAIVGASCLTFAIYVKSAFMRLLPLVNLISMINSYGQAPWQDLF